MTEATLSKRQLSPEVTDRVIAYLGGPAAVARLCRVSRAAVSQWKQNGMPEARIMFLREKFKDLPVMKSPEVAEF